MLIPFKDTPQTTDFKYDVGRNKLINEIVLTMPVGKCVLRRDLLETVLEMRMPQFEQQMKEHTFDQTGTMPEAIPSSALRKMQAFKRYKNTCVQMVSKIIREVGDRPGFEIMWQEFDNGRSMAGVKRVADVPV